MKSEVSEVNLGLMNADEIRRFLEITVHEEGKSKYHALVMLLGILGKELPQEFMEE